MEPLRNHLHKAIDISSSSDQPVAKLEDPGRRQVSRRPLQLRERIGSLRRTPLPVFKRFVDYLVPLLAAPFLLPLFLVVGLWIKLTSKGPVLFKQERIGLDEKPFFCYKFRSMREDQGTSSHEEHVADLIKNDKPMTKLDSLGDSRLIPGGAFLRSTGIDELPQILNVLKGDMSLVGPRPITSEEFEHYTPEQKRRFKTVPGITGYWQVKGKNRTTFTEMLKLDEYYTEHYHPLLDLLIILRTPAVLFLQLADALESRIAKSEH